MDFTEAIYKISTHKKAPNSCQSLIYPPLRPAHYVEMYETQLCLLLIDYLILIKVFFDHKGQDQHCCNVHLKFT